MDKKAVLLFKREIMDFYDDSLLNAEHVTMYRWIFHAKKLNEKNSAFWRIISGRRLPETVPCPKYLWVNASLRGGRS